MPLSRTIGREPYTQFPLRLAGAVGAIGLKAALTTRKWFTARLDALGEQPANAGDVPQARTTLPLEVKALTKIPGASEEYPTQYVDLRQSGTTWFKLGGTPHPDAGGGRIGD